VLCAVALAFAAPAAAPRLNLTPAVAQTVGILLLALHAAYVLAVLRLRGTLRLRWFEAELPTPRLTAWQYALGLAEVLAAATVLYVLLPEGTTSFLPFVAVYVVAILAGVLSSVPAGLGVFESMLLLMLRDVPPESLLGAVLAYRLLYELVPFLAGVALFLGWEVAARRR
jgi:phosphatidylglycerol lysyltransferase